MRLRRSNPVGWAFSTLSTCSQECYKLHLESFAVLLFFWNFMVCAPRLTTLCRLKACRHTFLIVWEHESLCFCWFLIYLTYVCCWKWFGILLCFCARAFDTGSLKCWMIMFVVHKSLRRCEGNCLGAYVRYAFIVVWCIWCVCGVGSGLEFFYAFVHGILIPAV